MRTLHLAAGVLALAAITRGTLAQQTGTIEQLKDGVVVVWGDDAVRVQVYGQGIVRVTAGAKAKLGSVRKSLSVIATPQEVGWDVKELAGGVEVDAGKGVKVLIDRQTRGVTVLNGEGKVVLKEAAGGRIVNGHVAQRFELQGGERVYGLGQHQEGAWNYRGGNGSEVKLQQENKFVAVPVMVLAGGPGGSCGVIWDNPAVTLVKAAGKGGKEGRGGNEVGWDSEAGEVVDYYVVTGSGAGGVREVEAGIRALTGDAPLFGRWTWGLWQSKERYKTQAELLGVAKRYRDLGLPIDGVIQDWQYWKPGQWGSHEFDEARFSDPAAMVKQLHEMNFHVIISIWSRFDVGTKHGEEMAAAGAMYPTVYPNVYPKGEGRWYDAYSEAGRATYWKQVKETLAPKGFDGWWMDATEAELGGKPGEMRTVKTALGSGAEVYNAYPLMATTGVHDGMRAMTDDKRVLILTRSAYTGQQRNGAITWSGDIQGDWKTLSTQVPAGLNFVMSGIPYWNTDIGGFFGGNPRDAKYQELFSRWFQYGTFTPMMRVHGTGAGKEYWQWDARTQGVWREYTTLRYRLLPYIYSLAWEVTNARSLMMRPLAYDFAQDEKALDIGDQFMFGAALMPCPVTKPGLVSRQVYLPANTGGWYDFWTGKPEEGGTQIEAAAPVERMPLFVPAGAVLPLGPEVTWAREKPDGPLEIRIYPGADGSFNLYEDAGDGYGYEKGEHAITPLTWDDKARKLTLGKRQGTYPGMPQSREFHIVLVSPSTGTGTATADGKLVKYEGDEVLVELEK